MKVLVAPLNWGLGHATRDIPLIRELEKQGAEVVLASDGAAFDLLKREFPGYKLLRLPGWNVTYSKHGKFTWHMLRQSIKVLSAIKKEHIVLEKIVKEHGIDIVISDNRLGCFSKKVPSVILSHQVFLKAPAFEKLLNYGNTRYFKNFGECWVVDLPGENNLSGILSHREKISFPHRFIGLLSRFEKKTEPDRIPLLAMISGPEPQRTFFEEEVLEQMEKLPYKSVALLGKPGGGIHGEVRGNVTIYSHLQSDEIQDLLNRADVVVSRTGYTTVMDLVLLGKKALMVPTPGQPEQEYLAEMYAGRGWYILQKQGAIDLAGGVEEAGNCQLPELPQTDYLSDAIAHLLKSSQ